MAAEITFGPRADTVTSKALRGSMLQEQVPLQRQERHDELGEDLSSHEWVLMSNFWICDED